ncbi:MAG TPA: nucleotidyl transferase AbiEii/AbiGii toxin family protein [Phycisphaerae bacterium]|jgi:hypothetical protein
MGLQSDLRQFIELLNSVGVKYVIVGGYAVAFHGHPRYTGDIDFLVQVSDENARRIEEVLRQFGFGSLGLTAGDFLKPDVIVQLGYPPYRIDILTSAAGIDFDEAWNHRVSAPLDGTPTHFISRDLLLANKAAVGRTKDIADIDAIQGRE